MPNYPTYEELRARLDGKTTEKPVNPLLEFKTPVALPSDKVTSINVTKYDISNNAIYDKLSDGTLVARFENYKGNFDNEDRLAREQSTGEQIWNGITKNARKMGNYVFDATVGTVYGLGAAIADGKLSSFYNNDFGNMMDDWNKQLDYKLPNYYTNEQKAAGFLESLGTANFWANDFAGGLAFVGGALIPELALAAVTGGSTLATSGAKLGFKFGARQTLKTVGKELVEEALDPTNYISKVGRKTSFDATSMIAKAEDLQALEGGLDLLKAAHWAKTGNKIGTALDTALFVTRTSGFEAGMEARHNYKESVQNYIDSYIQKHGEAPGTEELTSFMKDATAGADWVFGANMAILSVSNAAMFGNAFNVKFPKMPTTTFGKQLSGLNPVKEIVDGIETRVLKDATKTQKFIGNASRFAKPILMEGLYEEGLQGVAGKTMQNYLDAKYDPSKASTYSFFSSLGDALGEQYGTSEGWKEIMIGGLIGLFGGPAIQPRGKNEDGSKKSFISKFPGFGENSRKAAAESIRSDLKEVNAGVEAIRRMNRADSVRAFRNQSDSTKAEGGVNAIQDSIANKQFIKSGESIRSADETVKEYEQIIDAIDLSKELGGWDVPFEKEYKQQLKDNFRKDLDNYKKAQRLVEDLNLAGVFEKANLSKGNIYELKDAAETYAYLGFTAKQRAKAFFNDLESLNLGINTGLITEVIDSLSGELIQKTQELSEKQRDLIRAQKQAEKQALRLNTTAKDSPLFKTLSEQSMTAQQRVLELQEEVDTLSSKIEQAGELTTMDGKTYNAKDLLASIQSLDYLDEYVQGLRKLGKYDLAKSTEVKLVQVKAFLDTSREASNFFTKLAKEDFFSSKEGKAFTDQVVGKPYSVSKSFKELVDNNNEFFDKALGRFGYEIREAAKGNAIAQALQNNPDLSEREKYKLETLIRLQLSNESLTNLVNETMQGLDKDVDAVGDSLPVISEIKEEDLYNLETLNKLIDGIFGEIENLRGNRSASTRVKTLEEKIAKLKQQQKDIQDAIQEQSTTEIPVQSGPETSQEMGEEVRTELEKLTRESEKIDEQIKEVENQIEEVKNNKYTFPTSPEIKEFEKLTRKRNTLQEPLSEEEENQYQELKGVINDWIAVTGTVTDGYSLADLITQRDLLQTSVVVDQEAPLIITDQEVIDNLPFTETNGQANSDLTLGYYTVQVTRDKDGNYLIIGMTPEAFFEEAGLKYAKVENGVYKVVNGPNAFEIKQNQLGNIILTQEVMDAVNNNGKLAVVGSDNVTGSAYKIVYKIDSSGNGTPLKSNYSQDFAQHQDPNDVYDTQTGDKLSIEIDPADSFNKKILAPFKGSQMPSEELTKKEQEFVQSQVNADKTVTNYKNRIAKYKEDLKRAKKSEKAGIKTKIVSTEDSLRKRTEKITDAATKKFRKDNNINITDKQRKEALRKAQDSVVMHIVKDGVRLQTLKGIRYTGKRGPVDDNFQAMREALVTEEVLIQLANTGAMVSINVPGLEIDKVLLGQPNLLISRQEDGSLVSRLETPDKRKVVTIGYVENGVAKYRNKELNINEYFITNLKNKKGKGRIPIVVFKKGSKYIAYPATLNEREKKKHDEFKRIFESNLPIGEKATALNTYMAKNGIGINQPGNMFYFLPGKNNMDNEFFSNKLAQLVDFRYFYNMDEWLDPKTNQDTIVEEQIKLGIDLSDPINSPKIKLKLPAFSSSAQTTKEDEEKVGEAVINDLLNTNNTTTQKAEEEIKTDCKK